MDSLNERLANLGQAVAEVNAPDHDAIADARRRWARSGRRTRGRRWTFVVVPAFAVAAAVIAVILTRTPEGERTLTYSIGAVPGERGQWIAAREPVQLRFSDGSHIEVARDAKMRVAATDQRGSTIDLEQGALHAEVVHRDVSSWHFRTGPYTVLVKGTRFDAAWDSTRETFTLDMLEGKVEISGPLIPAPVSLAAGQSVVANVAEKRFEIRSVRTADAADAAKPGDMSKQDVAPAARPPSDKPQSTSNAVAERTDPRSSSTAAQDGQRKAAPASRGSAVASPTASVSRGSTAASPTAPPQGSAAVASSAASLPSTKVEKWREYLAARAYSSAIKAAEQRGFDAVVAEATSAELYALSDAARYAGRLARARDALITLRARFNEQGKTAFLLGRIAADEKDAAGAIEWFDRYLQEQPGGPLAETATGRLIELYKPRDAARARKLAERYLAAYPDGSYAALAQTLVEK